jgi:hypothetical protein
VRRVAAWTRQPLVRFAVAGAVLLGLQSLLAPEEEAPPAAPARAPIVVSAAEARALEARFVKRWGRAPSQVERRALVDESVQEEMLFREARVLALGFGDASVRRRLIELARGVSERPGKPDDELVDEALALGLDDDVVIRRLLAEKMRLVLQQDPAPVVVRDEELARLLDRQRERFAKPAMVTLTQVFLSPGARGGRAEDDAQHLLASLRAGEIPSERVSLVADPLPLGTTLRGYTRLQLQGRFGKGFADRVFALEPGAWQGPIASPFGLHLVRVEEKHDERLPELDEVRSVLLRVLARERAQENLARGLARLRRLYGVRVEGGRDGQAGVLAGSAGSEPASSSSRS